MDEKVFVARKNLIDRTMHGKPCIEAYENTYSNPAANKFDPVSTTLTPREMCTEFVNEIDELTDLNKTSTSNAVRYSYLISQQVDLETHLIDSYSSCVESRARSNPRDYCIETLIEPTFDLYSMNDKAQVCLEAVGIYNELNSAADA